MVKVAVDHRREPYDRGTHAPLCQRERVPLSVNPGTTLSLIVLGARSTRDSGHRQHQGAAGGHEGLVGADQGLADRLDGRQVRVDRAHEVAGAHRLMLEGEVDHAVGLSSGGLETLDIVEVAAADLCTECGNGLSGPVGAGEADDLVAVGEQFGNGGGGDVA